MTKKINSEVDLPKFDRRIYLTNNIENRNNYSICLLSDLDKDQQYDLHIEYIEKVRVREVKGLNYGQLRNEILNDLMDPSNQLMKIFIASSKGGKKE